MLVGLDQIEEVQAKVYNVPFQHLGSELLRSSSHAESVKDQKGGNDCDGRYWCEEISVIDLLWVVQAWSLWAEDVVSNPEQKRDQQSQHVIDKGSVFSWVEWVFDGEVEINKDYTVVV